MASLRFRIQRLIRLPTCHYDFDHRGLHFRVKHASRFCANFVFSTHHDFAPISARFRTNFMFSTHHDFARNCVRAVHIFVLGPELHFRPCPDLRKFRPHQSNGSQSIIYVKCHLQPYKRFLQMTCNCGTPLIHILHAQNIVDIFFIHFHLSYHKNPENKNHVCIN